MSLLCDSDMTDWVLAVFSAQSGYTVPWFWQVLITYSTDITSYWCNVYSYSVTCYKLLKIAWTQ